MSVYALIRLSFLLTEVNTGNFADGPRLDQLKDLGVMRRISVIERHADLLPSPLDRREDLFAPGCIYCHRLLRNDITSQFQRSDNVYIMRSVHSCDDDLVRFGLLDHLVEVASEERRDFAVPEGLELRVGIVHASLVGVAEGYDAGGLVVIGRDS